ncbi:MAG: DUF4347 domain-containing protein, partial [Microcoleaceae cyanobacterium]
MSEGYRANIYPPGLGMLVIIDSMVENYQMLASGVLSGAKVVILKSGEDGVRQITGAVANYSVSSLHIVCHGSPGSLQLGNTKFSLSTLTEYERELEKWGEGIGSGGILLYGCEVAAGDIGVAFVGRLHELSGVGVAAAVGRVGSGKFGGSWEFPVKVGEVGDGLAFEQKVLASYDGILQEDLLFASQINSPPIAEDDSVSTSQNTPVTFSFLSNDSDPDGDNFGIDSNDDSSTNGGTVELNIDGTFTYTPPTGFTGTDTFNYTIIDDFGNTDAAVVTITVTSPSNQPPTNIELEIIIADEPGNTQIGNLSTIDPDTNDSFTYALVAGEGDADNNLFEISDDQLNATTNLDFEETNTFTIRVQTTDSGGATFERQFSINLLDVNEAPNFTSAPITSATVDTPYSYDIATSDPDTGDILEISISNLPNWLDFSDNGNGTASLTGTPDNNDTGNFDLELTVTDSGDLTDTQNFRLEVATEE